MVSMMNRLTAGYTLVFIDQGWDSDSYSNSYGNIARNSDHTTINEPVSYIMWNQKVDIISRARGLVLCPLPSDVVLHIDDAETSSWIAIAILISNIVA